MLKSYAMPVDATVFAGVPSVTALKQVPSARMLLAAAMDRRVVGIELDAEPPKTAAANAAKQRIPARHLPWSHERKWIHTLDVHPDGTRVATGGTDRLIKIWKWGRDERLTEFEAHGDCVRALAFSPDGRRLASAGDDGQVKVWTMEIGTREPASDIGTVTAQISMETDPQDRTSATAPGRFIDTLAWSIDSKLLLSSGNDGILRFWNPETGKLVNRIDVDNRRLIEDEPLNGGFSYPGGIRRLTVSPDGKRIAAVGLTSLCVLEMATGKIVHKIDGRAFGAAFDPASRLLAFSQEKNLLVWDFQAGRVSHQIVVDQLGMFGIVFLQGSQQLASGGCNGWVGIWDLTG
jgi:WD40 repeat protein